MYETAVGLFPVTLSASFPLLYSYPQKAEWAGDKLETELPAGVVGNLLREYSRPFILAESREKGSNHQVS